MQNVTLDLLYHEIRSVKQELHRLESILVPEVKLSGSDLKELKMLNEEAKRELRRGKLIPADEL